MRNNQFVTGNYLLSNDNAKAKEESMIKGKVQQPFFFENPEFHV